MTDRLIVQLFRDLTGSMRSALSSMASTATLLTVAGLTLTSSIRKRIKYLTRTTISLPYSFSGILTTHEEFNGRATWGTNTIDDQNEDCNGHGTHVAGTVGGK